MVPQSTLAVHLVIRSSTARRDASNRILAKERLDGRKIFRGRQLSGFCLSNQRTRTPPEKSSNRWQNSSLPPLEHHHDLTKLSRRPLLDGMARQVKLFLIRHGETVDNVAQLYAGNRDSALTNHGYQQATRLGQHFRALGLTFTHIFSSHLQRAAKTAALIRDAQVSLVSDNGSAKTVPEVVRLPALMEQGFGYYEGKKFHERPIDLKLSGKELYRLAHKNEPGFVDVESKESMDRRADGFLDERLLPLLNGSTDEPERVIAIVSHGIMLSTLWKRLLLRLPAKSVALSPELAATARNTLEHLGGWSNTGYLELLMTRELAQDLVVPLGAPLAPVPDPPAPDPCERGVVEVTPSSETKDSTTGMSFTSSDLATTASETVPVSAEPAFPRLADGWMTVIKTINGKDHLIGLKRTGGGVGSSRYDASQKSIDSFFKRKKLE
ncbi:phosphoglycerate mutase-like protein [Byssothecium circinans]|uniref:Phosphoglycerate mutase-like protein n=1 Tax=Byssothecium circinans TaxID=147558 RepID=A0A6A5T626_9PLEO|nr:phosphoglycerate mutase-like protein [Byssothecium circinans]